MSIGIRNLVKGFNGNTILNQFHSAKMRDRLFLLSDRVAPAKPRF